MAFGFPNTTGERIKLNVGGKIFETTVSTLRSGGPESLLSVLSSRAAEDPSNPIFIDRDPEIFSVLLSLLRSNHLPSTSRKFSNQELADEALYYGIDSILKSAVSPPSFRGIDASLISTLIPSADSIVSSFTPLEDGSVWAAHGGQVSSYDWNLTHSCTIRTHLEDITSIKRVWNEVVVIGSRNAAGLHLYDFAGSRHVGSVHWTDPADPRIFRARIHAISVSNDSIFGSFDCSHKENCILAIDKSTLAVKSEIGRQNGGSAKTMVAGKLIFLPDRGVLVSSAVTAGAFGYSGYIRLWDPRSGDVVWETNEPGSGRSSRFGDSFADVDVDVEGCKMFKMCSKSGDLGVADLRNLGDDPWVYLKDKNPSLRNVSGGNSSCGDTVLHCYSKQVFVGRDGGLEVWSRLEEEEELEGEEVPREGSYRRNFVDKVGDSDRGIINQIEGGGNRLFVRREEVEGIEVWESSNFSGNVNIMLHFQRNYSLQKMSSNKRHNVFRFCSK